MSEYTLYHGDCLEVMKQIPEHSIDLIICDPPYGTTSCSWDVLIPFEELWKSFHYVIKPNCAMIIFGTEPFSSHLRMSNLKEFKYDLIWKKSKSGSAFTAKYRPICKHENIHIFSLGGKKTIYNPQMIVGTPYKRIHRPSKDEKVNNHHIGFNHKEFVQSINDGFRYPCSVLEFPQKWRRQDTLHPTQKPVELLEYLIKTYSNEDMIVLDPTMGSGSTGIACLNTNRNFIGIEKDEKYFEIAKQRIENHKQQLSLF